MIVYVPLCMSHHLVIQSVFSRSLIRSLRVPTRPSPSMGFSFSRVLTLFLLLCPSSSFVSGSRALPAASAFHGFTTTPLRPQRHDAGAHCDDISAGPSSSYSDAAGPSSYVIFVFTGRFALLTRQAPAALTSRQAPAAQTLMRQAPAVLSSLQAPAARSLHAPTDVWPTNLRDSSFAPTCFLLRAHVAPDSSRPRERFALLRRVLGPRSGADRGPVRRRRRRRDGRLYQSLAGSYVREFAK